MKTKAKKRKMADDGEIEEITIDDDEDSVGYVSQTELESKTAANINAKANKFINGDTDDDFDSDVSLEQNEATQSPEDTAFTGGHNLEESREATCYLKFSLIKSVHNISIFSLGIFRNDFFEWNRVLCELCTVVFI